MSGIILVGRKHLYSATPEKTGGKSRSYLTRHATPARDDVKIGKSIRKQGQALCNAAIKLHDDYEGVNVITCPKCTNILIKAGLL